MAFELHLGHMTFVIVCRNHMLISFEIIIIQAVFYCSNQKVLFIALTRVFLIFKSLFYLRPIPQLREPPNRFINRIL